MRLYQQDNFLQFSKYMYVTTFGAKQYGYDYECWISLRHTQSAMQYCSHNNTMQCVREEHTKNVCGPLIYVHLKKILYKNRFILCQVIQV